MNFPAHKIQLRSELARACEKWREEGKRIGFTSGVYDLLHAGHIQFLTAARRQCDVLIAGLNDDSSVRENKGVLRPICAEQERLTVLAGLSSVDYAFLFSEKNNNENVSVLKPDVYFKAEDYTLDKLSSASLVEAHGGQVVLIPLREGCSSSQIIETVAHRYGSGEAFTCPPAAYERRPAIFVDRDGTINEHVEYLHEVEKLKLIPGALEGLKKLKQSGFRIVIATNQPGIGLGYFTKEDFFRVNKRLLKMASEAGFLIDRVYYAPQSRAENSSFRKPGTGMLERAAADLNVEIETSYVVGDMTSDIQLARNAGCKGVLVRTGQSGADGLYDVEPDFAADDLLQAADLILGDVKERGIELKRGEEKADKSARPAAKTVALEDIGKLTAKIGHDFNNLLGAIRGCADLIHSRMEKLHPGANPVERQLRIIDSSLGKAVELTSKLRGYVRPGPLEKGIVQLRNCLETVVELLEESGTVPCEVTLNIASNPLVNISEFAVVQMIMAVCINSVEAMSGIDDRYLIIHLDQVTCSGQLQDGIGVEGLSPGEYARLSIMDHGIGMTEDAKKKIFQPFYSTKQAGVGKGIGLSLAMAHETMTRHGGVISVVSEPDRGTVMHFYFPVAKAVSD